MQDLNTLSVGDCSEILDRPTHQIRRTVDQIWPSLPRVAGYRMIPRSRLCELAAAIERRYGNTEAEVVK